MSEREEKTPESTGNTTGQRPEDTGAQATKPEPEGSSSSMSYVSTAGVQAYLKGAMYPTGKQRLMDTAKSNGAPPEVMKTIEKMPEKQYISPTHVTKELGKLE